MAEKRIHKESQNKTKKPRHWNDVTKDQRKTLYYLPIHYQIQSKVYTI